MFKNPKNITIHSKMSSSSANLNSCSQKSVIEKQDLFEIMKNENNRFNSFNSKWPLDFIKVNDLAKYGFFYLLYDDKVQCAFCKLILAKWERGDEPLDQHQKFSSKCHFISYFVKADEPEKTVKVPNVNCFNTSFLNDSKLQRAKVPRMSDVQKRLSTYKGWSLTMISIEDLAVCGLFYTGVDDVVTCFSCGISLGDWEPFDEPMTKHSNLYPNCVFLHFVISSSHLKPKKSGKLANHISKPSTADILISQTVCKAKEIFPSSLVEEVVNKHLKETGEDFSSLEDLCNKILEYEEKKLKIRLSYTPTESELSADLCLTKTRNNDFKCSKDVLLCKICFVEEMGITFQPCGHLLSCDSCSQQFSKCPICRLPVQERIKTYLS